jgi:membrane-associated protease RseP (regulator of RpoE activity)
MKQKQKANMVVSQVSANPLVFMVGVRNKTNEPINFGENNVSAKIVTVGEPIVAKIRKDFPVYTSGILVDDRILSINNKPIDTAMQATKIIASDPLPVSIGVLRNNETKQFVVSKQKDESGNYGLGIDFKNNAAPVKIIPYENVIKKIKRDAQIQMFAAALAGGLNAYAASASAGNQYSYGNINGYHYSSYTYNPSAAQLASNVAQMSASQNMQNIKNEAESELAEANRGFLKIQTIMPNNVYGGKVLLEQPITNKKQYRIELKVLFSSEEHIFRFDQYEN